MDGENETFCKREHHNSHIISVAVPSRLRFSVLAWAENILSVLRDGNSIFKVIRLGVDVA